MNKIRLTAILLTSLTLAAFVTSCAEQDSGILQEQTTVNENAAETESDVPYSIPEVCDFNGYGFKILSKYNEELQLYDVEVQDGTTINDIIYVK